MAVILVVERDPNDAQQISDALRSEGWPLEIERDVAGALKCAAATAPRLVVAAASLPEIEHLIATFGRQRGGPGVLVLLDPGAEPPLLADLALSKPFETEELRNGVRSLLRAGAFPTQIATPTRSDSSHPLTSAEIFADVLAEVEAEVGWRPKPPAPPEPPPPAPTPKATRPTGKSDQDDIDRQLERTLSGVLDLGGVRKRASSPPAEARSTSKPALSMPESRPVAKKEPSQTGGGSATDIDDLLDRTLSSLELPSRPRKPPSSSPESPKAAVPDSTRPNPEPQADAAPREEPAPPIPAEPPTIESPSVELAATEPTAAGPPATGLEFSELEIPEPEPASQEKDPFSGIWGEPDPSPTDEEASAFRTLRMPSLDQLEAQAAATAPGGEEAGGETFGEYTLLQRIALGGMAEVWKARRRGVEGFQKTVAIKRILSHLTATPDFVTMFIDEAKLAAQLNHDNIIQIYDLGKQGDDFFIAMEYVEGKDLRTIFNAARQTNRPLPTGLALLVAARVARALDYAHRKRDFDNRELGLVHRDVSPQNVLISYEGEIKLCDFGIVKAVAKASTTQMGALKGKLQYMSPEQAHAKAVDARSDVFSLGSVLYEMLTGRKLFVADTEVGVLDAVRECEIPPLGELDPGAPTEKVERIVQKALAKRPEERYQTAGELEQELESVLYSLRPTPSQSELAAYMERLVREPGDESLEPPPSAPETGVIEEHPATDEPTATAEAEPRAEGKSKTWLWLVLALAALALLGAGLFAYFGGGSPEELPATPQAVPAPELEAPPAEQPNADPSQGAGDSSAPKASDDQAGTESGEAATANGIPSNLDQLVEERLGEREENLRKKYEAEKQRLEAQLRETLKAQKAAEEELRSLDEESGQTEEAGTSDAAQAATGSGS